MQYACLRLHRAFFMPLSTEDVLQRPRQDSAPHTTRSALASALDCVW